MLYTSFRAFVMFTAFLGLLHMIAECSFIYMFFPIIIIIWGIYSFFDENDKEYLRMNGIDPDEVSWFFPDYADYGTVRDGYSSTNQNKHHSTYTPRKWESGSSTDYSRYAPNNNADYNGMKKRCKRSFKITLASKEDIENEK